MKKPERILVIRLGALGDLVLCFQAFYEIRQAHPDAEIALLTMPAFAAFACKMPWFDRVIIDERAPGWRVDKWIGLVSRILKFGPARVYDLQGKLRQGILFFLLGGPLTREWSGAAPLSSHSRLWPPQPGMHYTDFAAAQLRKAGIPAQAPADLSWLDDPLDGFDLSEKYVALIPGCAPGRDYKRWPTGNYAALARRLREKNIPCVAVGSNSDRAVIASIRAASPDVIDLSGKTDLLQLAAVLRRSLGVAGNDTGPTHIAAAVGSPTLALMSDRVDPAWSKPKGPQAKALQGKPLLSLTVDKVLLDLTGLLDNKQ